MTTDLEQGGNRRGLRGDELMNTTDIMHIALEMAGFDGVPGDSEIFHHGEHIRKILFGIDIRDEDVRRAKELGMDLVVSHHPPNRTPGRRFVEVIEKHAEFMVQAGVPPEAAKAAIMPIREEYRFNPLRTHDGIAELARNLNMPLMNIHQPCDEIGRRILQGAIDRLGRNGTIRELMGAYAGLDEIRTGGEPVELVCGKPDAPIGKGVVVHGAGTNGGYAVADELFRCGVGTVVYIHLLPHQQADRDRLRKENKGNLIVTGHYPSDALGINPLIAELERRGMEVTRCNNL